MTNQKFCDCKQSAFAVCIASSQHQGPTALHHSSTKATLKNGAGNGLFSFPAALFWFFFGQAKKNNVLKPLQRTNACKRTTVECRNFGRFLPHGKSTHQLILTHGNH